MYLCFSLHKLERFSSHPGELHFKGFVKLLRYVSDNNNLGLRYYANTYDAPISGLLRHSIINTENQLMVFSDYRYQYFPDTYRSPGAYIVFYQGLPIYHFARVPCPVAQSIS